MSSLLLPLALENYSLAPLSTEGHPTIELLITLPWVDTVGRNDVAAKYLPFWVSLISYLDVS